MTNLDRTIRRVQIALFLFGAFFVVSIGGLWLGRDLLVNLAPPRQLLGAAAFVSTLGMLLTVLLGWIADRRTLRRQELDLEKQALNMQFKAQELDSKARQHELELQLKEQELQKEIEVREDRLKIRELEHTIKLSQLDLKRFQGEGATSEKPAPPALTRSRPTISG